VGPTEVVHPFPESDSIYGVLSHVQYHGAVVGFIALSALGNEQSNEDVQQSVDGQDGGE
jgi:hypothetical protein